MALLTRRSASDEGESREGRELNRRIDEIERKRYEDELAKLKRRVAKARAEKARSDAEYAAKVAGGPCVFCGLSMSRDSWHGSPSRIICAECYDDHWTHDDGEHRSLVIHMLVDGPNAVGVRTYNIGATARSEVRRTGFKWWSETPGAKPGGWKRFAYLDVPRLRERLAAPTTETPPRYSAGDPCDRCGCAYLWGDLGTRTTVILANDPMTDPATKQTVVDKKGREVYPPDNWMDVSLGYGCHGCVGYSDLDDVLQRVVGVQPTWVATNRMPKPLRPPVRRGNQMVEWSIADEVGLTWYSDRPTKSRDRASTLAPFAYLDLDTIRARALVLFPYESQWTNKPAYFATLARRGAHPLAGEWIAPYESDDE